MKKRIILQGMLRKKGLVFNNERIVKLYSDGELKYFMKETPGIEKRVIDLKSPLITTVRF